MISDEIDALTGALSRPRFLAAVEREFFRCRRHERSSALVFLVPDDLDGDHDRPDVVDQILQGAAKACMETLRQTDSLGRLGRGEFGLLLPGTNLEEAVACAKRLRRTIQRLHVSIAGTIPGVTASVGVATVTDDLATPPMWFAAADIALYRAQCAGGNRIEVATPGILVSAIPSPAMTDRRTARQQGELNQ